MNTPRLGHAHDPSAALEEAFRRIARERMQGVPLLNPRLRVEALGFSLWRGHWLGVVVSPWFLNLVLVPGTGAPWESAREGEPVVHTFPCGTLAFLAASEPEIGEYQSCALSSRMGEYVTQDAARAVARAALDMLHRPAEAPAASFAAHPESEAPVRSGPMSKRDFLHRLLLR